MFKPKFSISNRLTEALTQIERARGFLEAIQFSEVVLREMQDRAFVLEAHHTTHIEGTQLTLKQSERLLAGLEVPEADHEDIKELLNYRSAFDLISKVDLPVSEALIREIHSCLVSSVRGDAAAPGEYRHVQNYVVNSRTGHVIYTPPAAYMVHQLMAELVQWLQSERDVHPVLIAGIAQFQFVDIHPFLDGNGRTARLLSTFCLYRSGYDFKRLFSLSEFYDRNRPAYYAAIQTVRDHDMDLTPWLEYFVGGLVPQVEAALQRHQSPPLPTCDTTCDTLAEVN